MADEKPKKEDIKPGTLKHFDADGKPVFNHDYEHPGLKDAKAKAKEAHDAAVVQLKEKAQADYDAHLQKYANGESMGAAAQKDLDALFEKHAPDKFTALKEARGKVESAHNEIKAAQEKYLKGLGEEELKKVEGYVGNEEKCKAGIKAFRQELKAAVVGERMFGRARVEGSWSAVRHNFNGQAWKNAPVKTAFKSAGVLVGIGAIIDAIFHSKRKDENGERTIDRSGVVRLGEGIVGAVLAGGIAAGGRIR